MISKIFWSKCHTYLTRKGWEHHLTHGQNVRPPRKITQMEPQDCWNCVNSFEFAVRTVMIRFQLPFLLVVFPLARQNPYFKSSSSVVFLVFTATRDSLSNSSSLSFSFSFFCRQFHPLPCFVFSADRWFPSFFVFPRRNPLLLPPCGCLFFFLLYRKS